jgi:hypothetical protein
MKAKEEKYRAKDKTKRLWQGGKERMGVEGKDGWKGKKMAKI